MPTRNVRDVLARQWAILRTIPREPRSISAADLHLRLTDQGFKCSRRTLERDLNQLESFGFGITCDDTASPNLWYWLKDATLNLPALAVSDALLLNMVHDYLAPILPPTVTAVLEPQFKSARDLLASTRHTNSLANWHHKVVSIPATQRFIAPEIEPALMDNIANALIDECQISVAYRSRSMGKLTELVLNPLGLVQRGQIFYLVATSKDYTDVRLYAVHRIVHAEKLDHPAKLAEGFVLHDYLAKGFGDFGGGKQVTIEFLADSGVVEHLQECRLSLDQDIQPVEEPNDWSRVHATVSDTPQLHWWLRGLGDGVQLMSITPVKDSD